MSTCYEVLGSLSRTGIACLGVGGGASSNRFEGRIIIRNGRLPRALTVRARGPLACELDQAIVPVRIGDVVLEIAGSLPPSPETAKVDAGIVRSFEKRGDSLVLTLEEVLEPKGWDSLVPWWALTTYHNRDGSPFVAA